MACPSEDFQSLSERLQRELPGTCWDLICFYDPIDSLPSNARVIRSERSLRFAASIWWRALIRPYRAIYVACLDTSRPAALAPLIEFVSILRGRRKSIVDRDGRTTGIGFLGVRTLISLVCVPVLLVAARLVTRVGLATVRPKRPQHPARGSTAIVVPLLPDISHTFVYREVRELIRRHPDYRVLILEEGGASVWHEDATELARIATVVPRSGPAGYLFMYLRLWLTRPCAMAHLITFFVPHIESFGPGTIPRDRLAFLRLEYLHHSNYLALGLMFADYLRREGISRVHVYGSTYPAVRALAAREAVGVPFSLSTFVDFDYVTPFHMLAEKIEAADFVVACTGFCAARLTSRFPEHGDKISVIHHALPAGYADGKTFRPRDGHSRLVYVGRFVGKKGLDTLIDACAILKQQGFAVACHLYGAGEAERALANRSVEQGLDGCVRFEGPIPNERFYSAMNGDDVFVCPSKDTRDGERDGIPVSLLEAMAGGMTVVSTPVSGIPELIESGRNGYLVEPDNPQALAELLGELLTNPDKRRAISAGARETIAARFDLGRSVDRLDGWLSRESPS